MLFAMCEIITNIFSITYRSTRFHNQTQSGKVILEMIQLLQLRGNRVVFNLLADFCKAIQIYVKGTYTELSCLIFLPQKVDDLLDKLTNSRLIACLLDANLIPLYGLFFSRAIQTHNSLCNTHISRACE